MRSLRSSSNPTVPTSSRDRLLPVSPRQTSSLRTVSFTSSTRSSSTPTPTLRPLLLLHRSLRLLPPLLLLGESLETTRSLRLRLRLRLLHLKLPPVEPSPPFLPPSPSLLSSAPSSVELPSSFKRELYQPHALSRSPKDSFLSFLIKKNLFDPYFVFSPPRNTYAQCLMRPIANTPFSLSTLPPPPCPSTCSLCFLSVSSLVCPFIFPYLHPFDYKYARSGYVCVIES